MKAVVTDKAEDRDLCPDRFPMDEIDHFSSVVGMDMAVPL